MTPSPACGRCSWSPTRRSTSLSPTTGRPTTAWRASGAHHPEVLLLCAGANLGFSAGNNIGIRAALDRGADRVLILNNDTVVDPQAVARMLGQRGVRTVDRRRRREDDAPHVLVAGCKQDIQRSDDVLTFVALLVSGSWIERGTDGIAA